MDSEDADDKNKQPSEQTQSGLGGSGIGKGNRIGTGGFDDDDCDCPQDSSEYAKIPAIVCHPNELLRKGICAIIDPVAKVLAECADGRELLSNVESLKPRLIILDPESDSKHVFELCKRIIDVPPAPNVLIVSNPHSLSKIFNRLVRAGVATFCLYNSGPQVFYDAIRRFSRGLPYCECHCAKY